MDEISEAAKAEYTPDGSPVDCRADTERQTSIHHSLALPLHLTSMFLGFGRKVEYMQRTHTGPGLEITPKESKECLWM